MSEKLCQLKKKGGSAFDLTATIEIPSKSQTMLATHDAEILVVHAYIRGSAFPTYNMPPEYHVEFSRTIMAIFRNVHVGDLLVTYDASALPYTSTDNSQHAIYYN